MTPAAAVTPVAAQPSHAFGVTFTPAEILVGHLRHVTAAQMVIWGVRTELAEDIVLAVSELVGNAAQHGKGDVDLRVTYVGEELRIAVTDENPAPAKLRTASKYDTSGRGLFLVAALSQEWGVSDDGLTTWCTFRAPARRP
ncbi:ATP-binding protein [Streptomyces sp. NPDC002787]